MADNNAAPTPVWRAAQETAAQEPIPASSERLRLLLFTNSVEVGGMEKHVELIARCLSHAQVEVFTVTPAWPATAAWSETLAGVSDHSELYTPDRRYRLLAGMREAARLWRRLRRWRIQVMHIHLTTYSGGLLALFAARLAGVRSVVCTEHLAPDATIPLVYRWRRNIMSYNFNSIICVSEANRASREQYLYTPADKTVVINNGIDTERFGPIPAAEQAALRERLGIPLGAPVVGSVVRLVEEKGLPYLFDAMPHILARLPDTHLLLAGDGPLRAQLEAHATRLGFHDHVIFAGFQADPRPYLSLMNAFVLPVPFGSGSIGLLEAMAMERACVITFGGKGEALIDGVNGLKQPPRDPLALADAILRVLSDPIYERQLGVSARKRIESAFSAQSVADQLLAIYQRTTRVARPASALSLKRAVSSVVSRQ